MRTGKLPPDILIPLLSKAVSDPSVLIGATYGEDAAAVEFGGNVLVAASDPITFTTDRIGYYAVSVNANDIAVHGAVPRWFLATILLPEGSTEDEAADVFEQLNDACRDLGVALVGGHTETTAAVERVVVCGAMLGETTRDRLLRTSGARPGDALVLAGGIAIEGTAILAREAAGKLREEGVSEDVIAAAAGYLDDPGICVLNYARLALEAGPVTSMHDPTEGGLATALRELSAACGHGIRIYRDSVPVLSECRIVCEALDIDPLGLIASGSLLIAAPTDSAERILRAMRQNDITASNIGAVVDDKHQVRYDDGGQLPVFERDEIARYFDDRRTA